VTLSLGGGASLDLVEQLLVRAVDISSVNAQLGGPGEAVLAEMVHKHLIGLGLSAVRQEIDGNRANIVAVLEGSPAPVLAFEAHMDTVATSGAAQARAVRLDGRIHGRGACDTKGSLVAMLEALRLLQAMPPKSRCTVVFAATVDEEAGTVGVHHLLKDNPRLQLAVVGEPTGLASAIAHKGLLRFRIRALGSPAHASQPQLGVNAIYAIGPVLDALQRDVIPGFADVQHPLTGHPTMAVTTINGGVAENVVPGLCTIGIDRRLNPGETAEAALGAVDAALSGPWAQGVQVVRDEPWLTMPPLNTPPEHPLVTAMAEARRRVLGVTDSAIGMPYGSNASWFSAAGVPAIVFGPGDISHAHSDDEWVELADVVRAAEVLAELACILAEG
jgi:acetylornithine deacetylase/succinyl-diaminopimelate desuccinylase-like protein